MFELINTTASIVLMGINLDLPNTPLCFHNISVGKNKIESVFLPPQANSKKLTDTGRRTITYSVETELQLVTDIDGVTRKVDDVLGDLRGWSQMKKIRFVRAIPQTADLRIILATPRLTDRLCRPLRTNGRFSCQRGNRVILNSDRYEKASRLWKLDIDDYRTYLINHEVGHYLGFTHRRCTGRNKLAPVMMQQTKGVFGCRENPWPISKTSQN